MTAEGHVYSKQNYTSEPWLVFFGGPFSLRLVLLLPCMWRRSNTGTLIVSCVLPNFPCKMQSQDNLPCKIQAQSEKRSSHSWKKLKKKQHWKLSPSESSCSISKTPYSISFSISLPPYNIALHPYSISYSISKTPYGISYIISKVHIHIVYHRPIYII